MSTKSTSNTLMDLPVLKVTFMQKIKKIKWSNLKKSTEIDFGFNLGLKCARMSEKKNCFWSWYYHNVSIIKKHFYAKNQKNLMIQSREKYRKVDFWANLGLKWALGVQENFFINFLYHLSVSNIKSNFNAKNKKNLMIQSREKIRYCCF